MFENIKNIFKRNKRKELLKSSSKDTAKERLHLVLMQDRANVSADFLDLMREEIIEVIKNNIDIDEKAMDVRLGAETNEDGTQGAPALYANIPIINIKDETRQMSKTNHDKKITPEPKKEDEEVKKETQEEKEVESEAEKTEEKEETNEETQEEIKEESENQQEEKEISAKEPEKEEKKSTEKNKTTKRKETTEKKAKKEKVVKEEKKDEK